MQQWLKEEVLTGRTCNWVIQYKNVPFISTMKGFVPAKENERDQVRRKISTFGQLIVVADYKMCMKRKVYLVLKKACKQIICASKLSKVIQCHNSVISEDIIIILIFNVKLVKFHFNVSGL